MADDKNARENQADDEQRRQREREVQEALDRGDEAEPPRAEPPDDDQPATAAESDVETRNTDAPSEGVGRDRDDPGRQLGDLDEALTAHDYPMTSEELAAAHGDREVESQDGTRTVADVLEPVEGERFDSADQARERILGLLRRA